MKHLSYFENKSDDQFHIEQIKDIFMEVIDEFGIDQYTPSSDVGNGIVYNTYIQLYNPVSRQYVPSKRITLWIGSRLADLAIDEIVKSKVLCDFERRLERVGYTFKKRVKYAFGDMIYYEIIISYK